jgi:RNA 2',3'-cyclic 3'-phosphodiesterase
MSRGATARLFAAIELPTQVRDELAGWGRTVAAAMRSDGSPRDALRLLDARSLHLTLCFLGGRPVGEIDALAAALAACAEDDCELSAGAPLWLPARRPQALAVEIHDREGRLARLQQRLSEALAAASGWLPERRRFRPHITVARVRRDAARGLRAAGERRGRALPATPPLSFSPAEIVLYRSWLSPQGASYEQLARAGLAARER